MHNKLNNNSLSSYIEKCSKQKFFTLFFLLILFLSNNIKAQSKVVISKLKIKSKTEISNENGISIANEKEIYDANGEVAEKIDYDKTGKIKNINKFKYNANNDVVEELTFNNKNKLIKSRIVKYAENGNKIEELFYDEGKKITKQIKYTYDKRGLKSEKRIYDGKGKLKKTTLFQYEFL